MSEPIYRFVNNGVYRCGFAGTQDAYDKAYRRLWEHLDRLEDRLTTRRYLVGDHITEADVRLFTTLVRFDPVYHGHFKCNRSKLIEMPALWGYARDLFQTPGFGDTVDFAHIKRHYYVVPPGREPDRCRPTRSRSRELGEPPRPRVARRLPLRRRPLPRARRARSCHRSTTPRWHWSPADSSMAYAAGFRCRATDPSGSAMGAGGAQERKKSARAGARTPAGTWWNSPGSSTEVASGSASATTAAAS